MAADDPAPVRRYFEADARRDDDALLALFTDDAEVIDEGQTWSGREAILAWREGPASKYQYTTEVADMRSTGRDRLRATGRIQGNFPGGTAHLNWDFTLAGELIRRLEIAP